MKEVGMKDVVKKKRPLLTKKHRRERLDFAFSYKDWTVYDWKRVFWSKLIVWGQMEDNGCGKRMGKA